MNLVDPNALLRARYDVVIVGSGFGSSFFLHRLLQSDRPQRILVLEWGDHHPPAWQLEHRRNSSIDCAATYARQEGQKPWTFNIGFGGGTNCWWAQTPRLHPSDFTLKSRYGVGVDWPLSYDDLAPYYRQAETAMAVSGDPDLALVYPGSAPFPQPPHVLTSADRRLKAARPDAHFAAPTARARVATPQRPACCASGRCRLCPTGAKFTVHNGMGHVYDDPRVEVALNCRVDQLETAAGTISGVTFEHGGRLHAVKADRCVLGANAIHSPAILLRSGIVDGGVGRGLSEQLSFSVEVLLDGLDHFDGSTITTGMNTGLLDGAFRSDAGAALVYVLNDWLFGLRAERGRWRQTMPLMVIVEDLPQERNAVGLTADRARPSIAEHAYSGYAQRGAERALAQLPGVLAALPVEGIRFGHWQESGAHLQSTLPMGTDPATSVVDRDLVHHRYRNLTVVGTAVFPTCPCANPSLTAAALALRAAERQI